METLAFIHAAIAHEDPTPDPEVRAFENIDFKASSSIAMGFVAAGVVAATVSHADQAQAAIYRGDQGSGVATLQSALQVPKDGIFGPRTEANLRQFQRSSGLVVDGIAGPATLSALGLRSNLGPGGGSGSTGPIAGGTYVTAGSGLLVRNAPAGYVISSLGYGQRVGLTGAQQYAGGRTWSQISGGGWVASGYLSSSAPGPGPGPSPIGDGARVTAGSGLLVRNAPAGYVIGSRGYGERVGLTGAEQFAGGRTWAQISGGGWVAKDYLF